MKPLFAVLAGLALVVMPLGACDKVNTMTADTIGDHVTAQLAKYQQASQAQDWQSIADSAVVDCAAKPDACGRLHGLRGNACLTLAMGTRTDDRIACPLARPDVRQWLDCAAQEYGAAEPLVEAEKRPGVIANRANAFYCRAETQTVVTGQPDAVQAEQLGARGGNAIGMVWGARGALFQARPNAGSPAARCAALNRSQALVSSGRQQSDPATIGAFDGIAHDIRMLRASVPACPS